MYYLKNIYLDTFIIYYANGNGPQIDNENKT